MNVHTLTVADPRWPALLAECDHDFYHLPSYVALCGEQERAEPCALLAERGDRRLLVPLLLKPLREGLRDAASPYGYPGPLATDCDPAFVHDALAAIIDALSASGIVTVFIRSHPLLSPDLNATGCTIVEHGVTVSIDLSLPPEQLWQQTAKGHRTEINKAMRAGHRAYFDEGFERLGDFARIYRATMERRAASGYYHFPDSYFLALRDALGSRLRLCLVEIEGQVAAAGLFVSTCGIVQYHLSGTDERFERERPTKLMLHFVRSWAREQGLRRFHLGGGVGGRDDSLLQFKAGFASDRHVFRTLRAVCDEATYTDMVRETHPESDPLDRTGFFPAYRMPA